jgi:hypothetical protein
MNPTDINLRGSLKQPTLLLMHVLAGRSILTVKSKRSGQHFTFRFSRPDVEQANQYAMARGTMDAARRPRPVWVALYGGVQGDFLNEGAERRNWSFIGTIWPEDTFRFSKSNKSKLPDSDPAVLTVAWIASKIQHHADVLLEQGEWWHEGICGRCGRRLTVPESIESGFGPECRKAVGL